MEEIVSTGIKMHESDGCLIVPVQCELYDEVLRRFEVDLLTAITRTGVKGVAVDLSPVAVVDGFIAETFVRMAHMSRLLGAELVLSGIRPAVASTMVDLGVVAAGISFAGTLDHALQMLKPICRPEPVLVQDAVGNEDDDKPEWSGASEYECECEV